MLTQNQSKVQNQEFSQFFTKQYQKVVNTFRARYNNMSQMEVEDIVSDLMTELLAKADISTQIDNMGAYLYRAVQNRVIDYLRRRKKLVSLDEPMDNDNDTYFGNILQEERFDMEAELDSIEIRERLIMALDTLKPDHRAVWVATELDGYPFRELSELWDIPMGTLLARKHRAVAALQKQLHDLKQ
jgi:RNA polymerase sigma factor (sigma-70 family)